MEPFSNYTKKTRIEEAAQYVLRAGRAALRHTGSVFSGFLVIRKIGENNSEFNFQSNFAVSLNQKNLSNG